MGLRSPSEGIADDTETEGSVSSQDALHRRRVRQILALWFSVWRSNKACFFFSSFVNSRHGISFKCWQMLFLPFNQVSECERSLMTEDDGKSFLSR